MRTTELGGHSGCRILLCEMESGEVFVRKISSGRNYNERLKAQAEKQGSYRNCAILTPRILSVGATEDGLFFFDMEYIRGISLAKYMEVIEVGKVRDMVETIINYVVQMLPNTKVGCEAVFQDKIDGLAQKLLLWNDDVLKQAIDMLKHHSWLKFYSSPCHGDLTLENIIVKNDQLYLIDFLDSFWDSWLLDIGTLLQDVQTLWAYRRLPEMDTNLLIRLIIFRDVLLDELTQKVGKDFVLESYYALLLKLVRICPYTTDRSTRAFLLEKIDSVTRTINEVD